MENSEKKRLNLKTLSISLFYLWSEIKVFLGFKCQSLNFYPAKYKN